MDLPEEVAELDLLVGVAEVEARLLVVAVEAQDLQQMKMEEVAHPGR